MRSSPFKFRKIKLCIWLIFIISMINLSISQSSLGGAMQNLVDSQSNLSDAQKNLANAMQKKIAERRGGDINQPNIVYLSDGIYKPIIDGYITLDTNELHELTTKNDNIRSIVVDKKTLDVVVAKHARIMTILINFLDAYKPIFVIGEDIPPNYLQDTLHIERKVRFGRVGQNKDWKDAAEGLYKSRNGLINGISITVPKSTTKDSVLKAIRNQIDRLED